VMDCLPGNMCKAGAYTVDVISRISCNGVMLETEMPYLATDVKKTLTCTWKGCKWGTAGLKCEAASKHYRAGVKSWARIPAKDDAAHARALANFPIIVSISAGTSEFQNYKTGILSCSSGSTSSGSTDHAVVAIGFASMPFAGPPYYWFKNSWGTNWGNYGYFYLQKSW